MTYLLLAYAVFWIGTFVLVLRMNSKEGRISKELDALREYLEDEDR